MIVPTVMTMTKINLPGVQNAEPEKDQMQQKESVVLILGVQSVVPVTVMMKKIGVLLPELLIIGKVLIPKGK
jgi:hypothetical protein